MLLRAGIPPDEDLSQDHRGELIHQAEVASLAVLQRFGRRLARIETGVREGEAGCELHRARVELAEQLIRQMNERIAVPGESGLAWHAVEVGLRIDEDQPDRPPRTGCASWI